MSKINEMLKKSYNSVVHSDISKLTVLEAMALKAISANEPHKLRELIALEMFGIDKGPMEAVKCPVVENVVNLKTKQKPKKK